MTMRVDGVPGLQRRLEAIGSRRGRSAVMQRVGQEVVKAAKRNTRTFRKTGNLGRGIELISHDDDSARVEARAGYSAHVEFGTRGGQMIRPVRRKALSWARKGGTGKGASRLSGSPRRGAARFFSKGHRRGATRAQPYMRPAIASVARDAGLREHVIRTWNRAD